MTRPPFSRLLQAASVLALAALALMTWSLFDPSCLPVIVAMSVGQALGTVSFTAFLYVAVADLRRRLSCRGPQGDAGGANESRARAGSAASARS